MESGSNPSGQAVGSVQHNLSDTRIPVADRVQHGHHFETTTVSDHAAVHQGDQSHYHQAPQYNIGNAHYGSRYHFGPSLHFHGINAVLGDPTSATSPNSSHIQADAQNLNHLLDRIALDSTHVGRIAEWLAPATQLNHHENLRSKRCEHTGTWTFEDQTISHWLSGWKKSLVLSGIAGCGKTYLTSVMVDVLRSWNAGDKLILFFYNNFKRQNEQSTRDIMASLLQQALRVDPVKAVCITDLYSSHVKFQTKPTTKELVSSLCAVSNQYCQTIIIFDAFDECVCTDPAQFSQRNEVWERLTLLQQNSSKNVSILVTTRPNMGPQSGISSTLALQAHPDDVRAYISQRLKYADSTAELSSSIRQQIQDRIVDRSSGMFLLAKLLGDNVVSMTSTRAILQSIEDVSKGNTTEEAQKVAYNSTMDRIKHSKQKDLAARALACAVACYRPLSVEEFRHAVSITSNMDDINTHELDHLQLILNACAGLLQVNKFSNVIELAHYTTQQYFEGLEDPDWFDLYKPHLGEACLNYLSMRGLMAEIVFNERNRPTGTPMPQFQIWSNSAFEDASNNERDDPSDSCVPRIIERRRIGWSDESYDKDTTLIKGPQNPVEVLHFYPFAKYAFEFWPWHIRCMAPKAQSLENFSFLRDKDVADWVVYFHPGHIGRIMLDHVGSGGFKMTETASVADVKHLENLRSFLQLTARRRTKPQPNSFSRALFTKKMKKNVGTGHD